MEGSRKQLHAVNLAAFEVSVLELGGGQTLYDAFLSALMDISQSASCSTRKLGHAQAAAT